MDDETQRGVACLPGAVEEFDREKKHSLILDATRQMYTTQGKKQLIAAQTIIPQPTKLKFKTFPKK